MDDEMIFIGSLLADTPLQRHCDNIKILTPWPIFKKIFPLNSTSLATNVIYGH
jgi:hypothetical protein